MKTSKPKVVAIIQARMGSTRLPGKMMLSLAGKPVLWHIFERAKKLKTVDQIVLATTTKKRDDVLAKFAKREKVKVFRGSEDDVLARFLGAAKASNADVVLRINADAALFDIKTADRAVETLLKKKVDVAFVWSPKPNAIGGFEVVTHDALKRVAAVTTKPYDSFAHEHVTVYLGLNPKYYPATKKFATRIILKPEKQFYTTYMHVAIDTQEDYEFMRKLYNRFYKKGKTIDLARAVAFLRAGKGVV